MARPERLELPTIWFEARYSIQLSYRRITHKTAHFAILKKWRPQGGSNPCYRRERAVS